MVALAAVTVIATTVVGPEPAAAAPSLVATKSVSDTTPAPGATFSYTIRFRCASTFEHCIGATLTDTVPSGLTIVSHSGAGGLVAAATKSGQTVSWTLKNPLTAGSTGLVTIVASYPACATPGFDPAPVVNSATFAATNGSPISIVATAPSVDGDPVPTCDTTGGGGGGGGGASEGTKDAPTLPTPGGQAEWRLSGPSPAPTAAWTLTENLPTGAGFDLGMVRSYGMGATSLEAFCNGAWVTLAAGVTQITAADAIPSCPGAGTYIGGDLRFPGVTQLRWNFPANATFSEIRIHQWTNPTTPVGTVLRNCAVFSATALESCATVSVLPGVSLQASKDLLAYPGFPLSSPNGPMPGVELGPNDIEWRANLHTYAGSNDTLRDPVITDLLDPNLEFVPSSDGGTNFWQVFAPAFNPATTGTDPIPGCSTPEFEEIENFAGTGRTLLRWTFVGCELQSRYWSKTIHVIFTTRIKPTTPAGTIVKNHAEVLLLNQTSLSGYVCSKNGVPPLDVDPQPWWSNPNQSTPDTIDYDGDGNLSEQRCASSQQQYQVPVLANAESSKWVQGALDTAWSRYPASGDTDSTGTRDYELYINNTGNTPLSSIDLIDVLPHVGDTSVSSPATPRGSQWGMQLVSIDAVEAAPYESTTFTPVPAADVTLGYSLSKNPCRWNSSHAADPNRLTIAGGAFAGTADGPAGCDPVLWADPAAGARSFAMRYTPATPLAPGATLRISVSVQIQPGEEPSAPVTGKVAWNSFGWAPTTTAAAPNDILLTTEPIQVGLKMNDPAATASLGDFVWVDTNHDGIQNEVGTGVAGVTVNLYRGASTTPIDSTLTDASGSYRFWGLEPNATDYVVRLDNPDDYVTGPLAPYELTLTNAAGSTDANDNDASIVGGFAVIDPAPVGAAGSHTPTYDFGFWHEASLGDYVWEDTNGNGAQDTGELAVRGGTVRLFAQDGTPLATTTTDVNGSYIFDGLAPGTYYVTFDQSTATSTGSDGNPHSGYRWTSPNATGDESNDSDASSVGRTPNIVLIGGQHDPRWDAGLNPIPLAVGTNSIGDYTWIDLNADGLQGAPAEEPPLAGVTVTLFDNDGPRATTITNAVGFYEFTALPDGDYWLHFAPPAGYVLTQRDAPTTGNANDAADSDVFLESGLTITTTLGPTEHDPTWDAGFTPTFSLGNFVWEDVNNDGVFDAGEPALEGIGVSLYEADGTTEIAVGPDGILGSADDAPGGVLTNATGNYLFTNLPADDYVVKIIAPAGYSSSSGGSSEPAPDPDTDTDDHDDNGTTSGAVVASGVVTLGYLDEPTGEGVTTGWPDATPDANGNYTVDFGLYQAPPTGSIEVTKTVGPDDDATGVDFTFELTSSNCTITPDPYEITITGAGTGTFTNLPLATAGGAPCEYAVTEIDIPTGWKLSSLPAQTVVMQDTPALIVGADWDLAGALVFDTVSNSVSLSNKPAGWTGSSGLGVGDGQGSLGMAVGPDGLYYVTGGSSGEIVAYNRFTNSSMRVVDVGSNMLGGAAFGPDGRLYFADISARSIKVWDLAADTTPADATDNIVVFSDFAALTDPTPLETGDNALWQGLSFGPNGTLYVGVFDFGVAVSAGSSGGERYGIYEVSVDGATKTKIYDGNPREFEIGPDGTFYMSIFGSAGHPGQYYFVSWDGTTETLRGTTTNATGFAFDEDGSLWVAYYMTHTIVNYDLAAGGSPLPVIATYDTTRGLKGLHPVRSVDVSLPIPVSFSNTQSYTVYSLGNFVWRDLNNDGDFDSATETALDGVTVRLFRPGYGTDGIPGNADDELQVGAEQLTSDGGYYLFTGLNPGDYVVEAVTPVGHRSSTGTAGAFEGASTPDADTLATDSDDNGSRFSATTTRTLPVTLGPPGEPTGEPATPGHTDTVPDSNGNYTVDFGFSPVYAVGNVVWFDADNDGIQDGVAAGETPVQNAIVRIFAAGGSEIAVGPDGTLGTADDGPDGVTTGADGRYYFDNLPPGDYYVTFTAPVGYVAFTTDTPAAPDALNDSNPDPLTGQTPNFTLGETLPAVDATAGDPATLVASKIDRTVDAGLVVTYSLGNRVWFDPDNSGDMGATELGAALVEVHLLHANGDPVLDAAGVAMTDTTDGDGFYRFDSLASGDYIVEIAASNFAAGGTLAGGLVSTGAAQEADPDTDVDVNDNGLDTMVAGAIRSAPVTLGSGLSSEPIGEVAGQLAADGQGTVDARANMTVDFGIYVATYAIGNIVWFDADRDGIQDGAAAGEIPVAGAVVKLFRSVDGSEVAVGSDGVLGTLDDTTGGVTTGADGLYYFDDLPAGDYFVSFTPPPDMVLTTDAPAAPNTAADSNPDPGTGETPVFTLGQALPNVATADGDPATLLGDKIDRTIDAGVVVGYSLGNRVWADADNSGAMNGTEAGIGGVVVDLLNADGTPYTVGGVAQSDTTDTSGFYRFDALPAGDYVVAVAASNFAVGGALYGGHPSTGAAQEPDPDSDVDINDNGLDALVAGAIRSAPVTLGLGLATEPTGEVVAQLAADGQGTVDARANMTVDFGIYTPIYTLGNLVWSDFDNDGTADVNEAPIAGVEVELWMDDPANTGTLIPALDAQGVAVPMQTTDVDGKYAFVNLLEGTYVVRLPANQPELATTISSGIPNPAAGDDVDGDNNGVPQADGSFQSGLVVLGPLGSEPTTEVDGLTAGQPDEDATPRDNLGNWSIDFGFYRGVRIGNLVWLDGVAGDGLTYDNGVVDAGETPLTGVTVELWADDGDGVFNPISDTKIDETATDSEGNYWFEGLTPSDTLFVAIPTVAPQVAGLSARSSTGQSAGADTADNDDDGAPLGTYASVSALFTVPAIGASPTGESDGLPAADGSAETEANAAGNLFPDDNSDLRLDFGFVDVPVYRIGNLVWIDVDKDGVADVGEAPIPGVRVELFDGGGNLAGFTTTDGDGKWWFESLPAGTYEIRIPTDQTVLDGYISSPVDEASADADGDNLDNGRLEAAGAYWTSGVVTLGNGDLADEPASEVDGLLDGSTDDDSGTIASPDDRSNLTVDFGFYQPRFAIGNEIWFDLDDSGAINGTEGYVPDGVVVNLLYGDGIAVLDAGGAPLSTTTAAGRYVFDNLLFGDYIVEVAASNFATGGLLKGYRSSTGQSADQTLAGDGADHGEDSVADGVRSGVFTLAEGMMPVGEDPNETTTAPDSNANMAADFGIYPTFSLGNEVWIDADDSGTLNGAEGYVADGIVLNLLRGDGTQVLFAGVPVSTTTVGGLYLFEGLPAGSYIVELAASNFAVGEPLYGYRSSTSTAGDTQTDQDDNGASTPNGAIRTGVIVLGGVGVEPIAENPTSPTTARDANSDLTVDLGVVPVFALGNEVWIDIDDSGTINNGESYVPDGVIVNLLKADGTPVLDAASLGVTTTTSGGTYLFDGLLIGDYVVELSSSNFIAGGALAGYRSSSPTGADDQIDQDDNGAPAAGGAIRTGVIHLGGAGAEPVAESPGAMTLTVDANHDLTVDLGVVPVFAIGNEVWFDADDSGTINNGEGYVPDGVIVNLLHPDGTPLLNGAGNPLTTTTTGGRYSFDNLLAGDYIVELAAANFMSGGLLETWRSSTGVSIDELITGDGADHGDDVESDGVRSGVFSLGLNAEPTAEDPNEPTVAVDANANMVADFGIVPMYALGNEVWFDLDDSGTINGTEPYVADGVRVNLLHADGTRVLDELGSAITTTTVAGRYFFDDLLAGGYIVELAAANFAAGGPLAGYRSSTLDAVDDQVDRNDNGAPADGGTIRSGLIQLGGIAAEPAGETPTSTTTARDSNGDLTVDFGVVPSFSIGNQVWFDLDDSGAINGTEPPVPDGVKVNLLKADGTPVLNADGSPRSTTTLGGRYLFSGLLAGTYTVELDRSNFVAGGPLQGARSSTFTAADDDVDLDDNGRAVTTAAGEVIQSGPIALGLNTEPLNENPDNDPNTRDGNENLTVDLGIVPLFSIGNEVWHDTNDDGLRGDPAIEPYVADGIVVNLLDRNGDPVHDSAGVARTTTTVDGKYLFAGLLAGDYIVELAASNFAAGAALDDHRSSTLNAEQNATDHDDNGAVIVGGDPFRSAVRSPVFTLALAGEPMGEDVDNDMVTADGNENLTVDFGVFKPVFSLGNQVWFDLDDDGSVDAGEPPVPTGTTVTLLDELGSVVATTTTDAFGLYLFPSLPRGNYRVEVGSPVGYRSSTPTEQGDVDNRDHGDDAIGSGGQPVVRSVLVVLDEGTEPIGENPDNDSVTPDGNENLSVDLGLVPLFSLGNEVWFDRNDNAAIDALEPYVPEGVVVNLLRADGSPVLDGAGNPVSTTTVAGMYLFDELLAGDYVVEIAAVNFTSGGLLANWVSSTGQTIGDVDRSDHGAGAGGGGGAVRSGTVTLSLLGEPTAEDPSNDSSTPDVNSNLTTDFGFTRLAIGNRLWIDNDGDGVRDGAEPGVGGVMVELWPVDASGNVGAAPVATTVTDPTGYYLFDGLVPGTYVIRVPSSQIAPGGPLAGYISTEGNGTNAPDPDDNVDDDDNGTHDETAGWVQTLPFDLAAGSEPIGELDLADGYTQQPNDLDLDANINLSVDLGFVVTPPLSLGNRVWRDMNNDGVMQDSEAPIDGVTVQLFRDDNADGVPDTDVAFQTDVTVGGGFYLFTGLVPGKYVVVVPKVNFAPGGPLAHMMSAGGSNPADNGIDRDDSGIERGGPTQDVRSSTVTLSFYDEPTGETEIGPDADTATDNNANLTVDFGFHPLGSLGDFVWIDTNRDGKQDPGEPGVDGVTVKLYDTNGTLAGTTTTAGGGKYLFEDLVPGGYTVEFVTSTLPAGHLITQPGAPGSSEADDSDGDPVTGRTAVFTVTPGGHEPRVDLGIYPAEVDLAVVKTVEGDVVANRDSTWKIVVSNNGRDAETGLITVTDNLPAQLTYVSANGTGWTCSAIGQVITCVTDADLPGNGSLPAITVIARVARNTTGEIINTATVKSPSTDLIQPNNASLAKAPVVKAGTLPGTGAAIGGVLTLGLMLLGLGVLATRASRRRKVAATF